MLFTKPHFDTVAVSQFIQKQSKAIEKTTLNWDIRPYLVYLHAVDIINQLHFSPTLKKQKEYFIQKEGRKQFDPENKKPARFVPSVIKLMTDIYVRPPAG